MVLTNTFLTLSKQRHHNHTTSKQYQHLPLIITIKGFHDFIIRVATSTFCIDAATTRERKRVGEEFFPGTQELEL